METLMNRTQPPLVGKTMPPDLVANQRLQQWEPLARRLACRFADRAERDDLEQIARFALWKAALRFDPMCGSQFFTFAVPTIIGSLRHYIRDQRSPVRIPRRWWEQHPHQKRMADALADRLGREPTVAELASWLGVSEEDVAGTMAIKDLLHPLSLDDVREGADGEETEALSGRIGAIDPLFEATEQRIMVGQALAGLPAELRDIIERRYFRGQPPEEVARQVGVSRLQVLRLERKALVWLREELRDTALA
jgi:RNA polymerase sigma-B factor